MHYRHGTIREIAFGAHRYETIERDGALITEAIYPGARGGSVKLSMHHDRFESFNRPGLVGADAKALAWIWPWDLVKFATNASGALVDATQSNPNVVYSVAEGLDQSGNCTPEACREVAAKLNEGSLKIFFSRLGQHAEFKASYPGVAQWARVIGGEHPVSPMPATEPMNPRDDRLIAIVVAVLATMGITMLVAGIILVASLIPLFPALIALLAPVLIPILVEIVIVCALGLIVIVTVVVIAVVVAVCLLIVVGLVMLSGTRLSVDEIAEGWNWIEPHKAAARLSA
jgi:hypothetical protein